MSSLNNRPSLIPQAKGYKGLGRNPNSKTPENKGYKGVGKSPEAKINDQIKQIDKNLAEQAKRLEQEPPPPIIPKGADLTLEEKKEAVRNARAAYLDSLAEQQGGGKPADGEMTIDQKLEAVRNAKSSITEKNSDELSQRPTEPPAEQPSEAPSKQQFKITTEVVEEKPERPELVSDTTVVESTEKDTPDHPFKVTSSFDTTTEEWLYEVYEGEAGGITIPTTDPKLSVTNQYFIYVKLTRDTYSRVVTAAELDKASEVPMSSDLYQYIAIAQVDEGKVTQLRFEDIRLTEFLISDAGELKLVSVFDTTNTYAPPPP